MAWLTYHEFIAKLIKTNEIGKVLKRDVSKFKQYEHDIDLYLKVIDSEYKLSDAYRDYKINSIPKWYGKLVYHVYEDGNVFYEHLITGYIPANVLTCKNAKKWGIQVVNPTFNDGLHSCEDEYYYELVGLHSEQVNLQQIRNCVHHPHYYGEIVCLT